MNETLLFEMGAVIFLAVVTAVFLYGLMAFRDWQDRDDTTAIPNTVVEPVTPAHRTATEVAGKVSRPSAA